jgi:hypothetical protein
MIGSRYGKALPESKRAGPPASRSPRKCKLASLPAARQGQRKRAEIGCAFIEHPKIRISEFSHHVYSGAMASNRSGRATALVRAEHGEAPIALSKPQRAVVNEACRLGHDMADEVASEVMRYGRWLLEAVFASDAAAAIDTRNTNPVWLELTRRAGGPTLRVSRHMLYTALQLAARDARIGDQAWRNLDAPRKELLLPLREDQAIRKAAQHVSKFNLSQARTRHYVTEQLALASRPRQVRLTASGLSKRVRALHDSLEGDAVLAKVRQMNGSLDASAREGMVEEVERLRKTLGELARALRRG